MLADLKTIVLTFPWGTGESVTNANYYPHLAHRRSEKSKMQWVLEQERVVSVIGTELLLVAISELNLQEVIIAHSWPPLSADSTPSTCPQKLNGTSLTA